MTSTLVLYAAAVFLLAGFVKGVIGVGFPVVAIGFLSLLVTPAQQGCEPEAEGAERMAHAVAPYVACITKATAAESLAQRVDSDCRRLRPSAVS